MRQKMESINYSSENQEPQRPEHDDLAGIGRSYDCVYCKRGFNTAQALGGHMNIHRKDRAARNPKPNNLNDTTSFNPNKPAATLDDGRENNNNNNNTTLNVPMYFLHQVSTGDSYPPPPPPYHHHQASQMSYRTHFPATTSAPVFADHHYYRYNTLDCDDGDSDGNNPQCLNLFENDWRVSLSLRHVDGVENIDDGVDLELRLGHDR